MGGFEGLILIENNQAAGVTTCSQTRLFLVGTEEKSLGIRQGVPD